MEYHHTFSCISSFSLSFVFTLLAKLFSLFSNSFSSMYSSNKVTCLQEEIAPKMVSSWRFGKQCKHIPPIEGNGKSQQGIVGKRFPTLRLGSLFLRFLYLLRLPHGFVFRPHLKSAHFRATSRCIFSCLKYRRSASNLSSVFLILSISTSCSYCSLKE